MTYGMEFHDSRLLELRCDDDGSGFALFHGCVYSSEGTVFEDAQESGWQNVRFLFEGMRVEGQIVEYASDGDLWVNGKNENGIALLPEDHDGDICLELRLSPLFDILKIHASGVNSNFEGDFELECLWDADGNVTRA
jgi:hypothetical protein